ncbi:MAG: heme exporter protein CcmB, partial [Bacteroidota bacterium]
AEVWNALFWIILLFASMNATAKSFVQEEHRQHYYYFLCKPTDIISAKLLYSFISVLVIAVVALLIYIILFGTPVLDFDLYLINLVLGCTGLSAAFTMVSSIVFKTSNKSLLMAVLGFPIIIPVLLLSVSNANGLMEGFVWIQIRGNVLSLLSVDVIIIALTYILFPYTWRS